MLYFSSVFCVHRHHGCSVSLALILTRVNLEKKFCKAKIGQNNSYHHSTQRQTIRNMAHFKLSIVSVGLIGANLSNNN